MFEKSQIDDALAVTGGTNQEYKCFRSTEGVRKKEFIHRDISHTKCCIYGCFHKMSFTFQLIINSPENV